MKNQCVKWLAASGLLFLFVCGWSSSLNAQIAEKHQGSDRIELRSTFFGLYYLHNGRLKSGRQIRPVFQENQSAFQLFKAGRLERTIGEFSSYVGGFGLGWLLVVALNEEEAPWYVYGMSAIAIPSIVFTVRGTNKIRRAVATYNSGPVGLGAHKGATWSIGGQQHGFGLGVCW